MRVSAYVDTTGSAPDVGNIRVRVRTLPKKFESPRTRNRKVERIVSNVAVALGVPTVEVFSPIREKTVSLARAVAMHVAQKRHKFSSTELGRYFGRDHTTVLKALTRVQVETAFDPKLSKLVRRLVKGKHSR